MNADNTFLDSLSEKVLSAVFEVSNALGAGFFEKVDQRALLRELSLQNVRNALQTTPPKVLPICWSFNSANEPVPLPGRDRGFTK